MVGSIKGNEARPLMQYGSPQAGIIQRNLRVLIPACFVVETDCSASRILHERIETHA